MISCNNAVIWTHLLFLNYLLGTAPGAQDAQAGLLRLFELPKLDFLEAAGAYLQPLLCTAYNPVFFERCNQTGNLKGRNG